MESAMSAYLPQSEGVLPYYMLVLSLISIGNSMQNLKTLHYTRRVYCGRFVANKTLPPKSATFEPEDSVAKLVPADKAGEGNDQVTPLSARCFGTWTLITAIVRCYAAYHLHLEPVYNMAYWTYVVALGHFLSEIFVFKTMGIGPPQLIPLMLASTSLVWMPLVKHHYVQA